MRASAAAEAAGFPTVSLVTEGFLSQAKAVNAGLGMAGLGLAMLPGHVDTQTDDELERAILSVTLDEVQRSLTGGIETVTAAEREPAPTEIVFRGTYREVNAHFLEREWSDGLPIFPPTLEEVQRFLEFTALPPEKVLGV